MKRFLLLLIVCITFFGVSQESYNFSVPQPVEEKNVFFVDPNYFGSYSSPNIDTYYEFNSEGIWAVSTIYSAILRETIRESSKYSVRNGYLFGVLENDSVPCFLEEERYHFGVKHKEQIIGLHTTHVFKKINNSTYIINFFENDSYTPSLLIFKGKELEIKHFDYNSGTKIFDDIKIKTIKNEQNMTIITLSPSNKEWNKIEKAGIFGKGNLFLRK